MSQWVIVGASRGIGLEIARQLVARGDDVLGTSRGEAPALAAAGAEQLSGVEMTAPGAGKRVLAALGGRKIDGLIVNAVAPNALRFAPPLIVTAQDVDQALAILKDVPTDLPDD